MTSAGAARLPKPDLTSLFPGDGDMASRCRAFDWASTPLGPIEQWSASLRTTVGIVLTSRQPMFLWWGSSLVQFYNDAYKPSLGLGGRADRALGACGREFWTEIWPAIGPQIDQVMSGGASTWHEDQYLPIERNGRMEDVWWTYSYSPVRDDDGSVAATLVVCQETTERVRLGRILEAERAQLHQIVDLAPAFMAVLRGSEHRFERFNGEYDRLVGGRARVGESVAEAFPEVIEQGFVALLDHVLATGEPFVGREVPLQLVPRDGGEATTRHIDFVYQALTQEDGSRSGIFVHGVDVSETVARRLAAERSNHRLALLHRVERALAGVISPEDLVSVVTHDVTEAVGASVGTVNRVSEDGQLFRIVAAEGVPEAHSWQEERIPNSGRSPQGQALSTGAPVFMHNEEEHTAWFPDRPRMYATWGTRSAAVLPLVVGDVPFGVIGFGFPEQREFLEDERDFLVTVASLCAQALERGRLFDAERKARDDAEGANRAKSEFLAVMSHELRTPLNAIGGYTELLELGIRGPVTTDQRVDLQRIQNAQRHLLGLINGVLNYAKVDAGVVDYALDAVPLDEVLTTCEALIAPQMRAKGLTLVHEPCEFTVQARGDREKIQQIVINLLSNAVKFTDSSGTVTMSCGLLPDSLVAIHIADTGIGIGAEHLSRVFDPFVQVDSQLTRTKEGTGLGLAISRDLARGMGGDLRVESSPRVGSTFTLTLPFA